MAINVNPQFIQGFLNPAAPPAPPMPVPNQIPGALGDVASRSGEILTKFFDAQLERAKKKKEIEGEDYRNAYVEAQTGKLGVDTEKTQQEMALEAEDRENTNRYLDRMGEPRVKGAPAQASAVRPTEAAASNALPEELAGPTGAPKAKSFDIEAEVANDSGYQFELDEIRATADRKNPGNIRKAVNDLRQRTIGDIIEKKMNEAIDPVNPPSREEVWNIYRTLDPNSKWDKAERNAYLSQFRTAREIDAARIAEEQEKRNAAAQTESLRLQNEAAKRADLQFEETKSGNKASKIERVVDNMENIAPAIASINAVQDAMSGVGIDTSKPAEFAKGFDNAFKALRGRVALQGSDKNIIEGLAALYFGYDPIDKEALKMKTWLESAEGQKALDSDEYRNVMIPVLQLFNNYVKVVSGSAVSGSEDVRVKGGFALSPLDSPKNMVVAMKHMAKELESRAKNATVSLDKETKEVYKAQGGLLPEDIRYGRKALTTKDQEALDWAEKNPNDPRAAEIKKALGK